MWASVEDSRSVPHQQEKLKEKRQEPNSGLIMRIPSHLSEILQKSKCENKSNYVLWKQPQSVRH